MMKLQRTYVMLVALILAFAGCDKLIYDQPEPGEGVVEHKVHLSVNVRAAQAKSGLRASINTDGDYEDYVYDLAMLIFNSDVNGELVGLVYLNNNLGSGESTRAFKVELDANKEYDFYFVANMPGMRDDLTEAAIPNSAAMDTYLRHLHGPGHNRELNSPLYHGASNNEGFPMARVYKNQLVEPGGTIYQPKPFLPKQYGSEEYKVVTNEAGDGSDERPYVELIRVVSKLEVILDASTDAMLEKISFRNANRHFRLVEFETPPSAYFTGTGPTFTELKRVEDTENNTCHYIYYMPEAIFGTTPWGDTSDNAPINYFTIEMKDDRVYDIPIITYNSTIPPQAYLDFATGDEAQELYSIYRNHHYKYRVNIQQGIEILYNINNWNVVKKSTYMGYGYNVEVDEDGKVTITNTIDDCMPHKVYLVAKNGANFGGATMVEYGYTSKDEQGYTDAQAEAGYSEDFNLQNIPTASGVPYLEVYYNKQPETPGVTPDKVFYTKD